MITAHPSAPVGLVRTLSSYSPADFSGNAAVLCRNNAPLVTHAIAAIRRGVPGCILGRDLGAQLTKIIKGFKVERIDELVPKLEGWYQREVKKLRRPAQRGALDDKYECLRTIATSCRSVDECITKIDTLFTSEPKANCLVLSTGHKAKGQEWQRVFILDQHLVPSRYAVTQAELWQEGNLLYVMVTRSMSELSYIKSNSWK